MVKINSFEIENVKRIKMLQYEPTANGLTLIGGRNNQGKTSVLDAIAWALGGDRFKPSAAQRDGALVPPYLRIELSNGIVVERRGKNSDLKVTDPTGRLAGQNLLNQFVEQFALNVPKFMEATAKEKAQILLKIIGVGDKLFELENAEQRLYNERRTIGQIADQKAKFAKEMPIYQGVPQLPVSASDLISAQQDILARNGENQRLRMKADRIKQEYTALAEKVNRLRTELAEAEKQLGEKSDELKTAMKSTEQLTDESTAEIEQSIAEIDEINRKVRANLDREKAEEDADYYKNQYDDLTEKIAAVRDEKIDLLKNADMPLAELSVENAELIYKGRKWDSMSGSDQLKVATAIVRKLNPECGFVLLDKLEQMDIETLADFGMWLEKEQLQAIATRVSTGSECSIIIEDGKIKPSESIYGGF
ncbi:MAG: AAA family ATPase [Clostridiaceae bacterium]|nr:AAA family ATPase [Clostridiaceae bacterium]